MADIIGGITSSHIPAIGVAMDRGIEDTPYWKDFFAGYLPVRQWLVNSISILRLINSMFMMV